MKNIFRFMKGFGCYIFIILVLLVFQAYCDLSLPNYTSDILNVGLQQNGIESAAPKTVRADTLKALGLFISDDDFAIVDAAYEAPDEEGIRKLSSKADKKKIADILMLPESLMFQMQQSDRMDFSVDEIMNAISSGLMTKEEFLANMNEQISSYGNMNETYLNQIAVGFVAAEYEAQGVKLSKIQNRYLFTVGGKMLLMALFMTITSVITGLIASKVSASIGMSLREQLYQKVMKFTNAEMEHFSTASLITRSTNDIQQVQMVTVLMLRMIAYAPIIAVFGIVNVIRTSPGMSWIIVLAVAILLASISVLMGVAMPKFKKMQTLVDRLNLVSREFLTGIMPIRAFTREKHEEKRFETANRDLFKTQLFTHRTMSFMMPIMMFIMNGVSVLIVWVGSHKVDAGTIQVGDLTAFITYSMVIVMSFLMLSMLSVVLPRAGVAANRIVEVLNTEIALLDPENPQDEKLADAKGVITFENVEFTYPGAEDAALENINFTAEPGKVTAIIGSTGCGKTTLVNLIPRFFDVTKGAIKLDGVDIRDVSQGRLRDTIGYVPQKGMLFSGTIESNIKYAGDMVSDDDMKEAAAIAQAEEFIHAKEDGFYSEIAQEGSNVSGGQRQRLSIARAIAKHPKVYLFDDSFSALDYKTDLKLRTDLMKYTGDSTVIIVAQRISTILHADKILCMDDGKIVGIGTHEELMNSCETYMEIAKSQLSETELAAKGGAC